ncbi:Hypothetical predicted protein [Podarcis lilfordi]|uniref:Uncharacterized protein n=1 Tax=Podarcis lilfordi TaxID=74358 RepID=A0AA35PG28_9SAUR|nr:Hypothetical predicted protein [Podarcis lilfordi]
MTLAELLLSWLSGPVTGTNHKTRREPLEPGEKSPDAGNEIYSRSGITDDCDFGTCIAKSSSAPEERQWQYLI